MSGAPPTDRERARAHAELLVLDAYRRRIATARTIGSPLRRRMALGGILTGIACHTWPVAGHADLLAITAAALALAEDLRLELHGPRVEPITTLRLRAGQPVLGEV